MRSGENLLHVARELLWVNFQVDKKGSDLNRPLRLSPFNVAQGVYSYNRSAMSAFRQTRNCAGMVE